MQSRNAPTASALSVQRQAVLARLLRGGTSAGAATTVGSIPHRDHAGPTPLSFEQQRIWFFHQLEPHSPLYTMPIAARLTGDLQPQVLRKALDFVAARHEALRSMFVGDNSGNPVQIINAPANVPMLFCDLRNCPRDSREAEARRLLEAEAKKPFDLSRDLMVRAALLQLDEREWLFLVLMHHIASDDWSWRIFCDELAIAYRAMIGGESPQLSDHPLQYADCAISQRESFRAEAFKEHLDYWKRELVGAPPALELPSDFPRPSAQTFRGACEWLKLPPALADELHAFSRRAGASLFMTLLAAFDVLIHRYTGQADIVLGSPVAGRTRSGAEKVIGLFVNMLALRVDASGNPNFDEFLRRVQRKVLDALAHQEMPFEKLVEELRPQRSSSHAPIIQVMFALQDELADNLRLPGLTAAPFDVQTGTAKFDLTFTFVRGGTSLSCCAEYNTDLFAPAAIRRMLRHYENLLQGIVANPERRLMELPLLSDDERNHLLVDWNQTEAEFPRKRCIHELFEARAKETPDAIAVVFEEQQLTYSELDQRANKLAHLLRQKGAGPESLVGVCMERSLEMVVALMAVLKSGGAYVPLDSGYPIGRLRFMLQDSNAAILLISERQQSKLGEQNGVNARVICMDSDSLPTVEVERKPEVRISPDNLAYAIYTSGSTGQPKGVQISHRAVVNLLHSMAREPGLTRNDTLLSVTSISFDIAALEIFLPLITGAKVVLANTADGLDGTRLAGLIAESGATVMQATPSLWRFLVESGWAGDKRLKIFCGGEALSRELADALLARGREVWNLYGPTETTIWSAACKIEPGLEPISVGRPIANTQIYVLDGALQLAPIGVPGELHIGGEGLARGYLNRPELTSEKFIPNPFASDPETNRLYKTGDIARFRPDGKIEILGRADHQIKLRGHRIETSEIESSLRQHPDVKDALVVLREDAPNEKQLVAYLVCRRDEPALTDTLRRFLKDKLPDYLVPSAFVLMERFPTTPNGKLDRNALRAPTALATTTSVPPRTETEAKVAEIWREILKLETVGVHDNFFQIGGHSLLAMQVVSRVCRCFGVDLSLRSMFETPTIAGLAETLKVRDDRASSHSIPKRRNFSSGQAKDLLGRLNTLSDQEVDALLEQAPVSQTI